MKLFLLQQGHSALNLRYSSWNLSNFWLEPFLSLYFLSMSRWATKDWMMVKWLLALPVMWKMCLPIQQSLSVLLWMWTLQMVLTMLNGLNLKNMTLLFHTWIWASSKMENSGKYISIRFLIIKPTFYIYYSGFTYKYDMNNKTSLDELGLEVHQVWTPSIQGTFGEPCRCFTYEPKGERGTGFYNAVRLR